MPDQENMTEGTAKLGDVAWADVSDGDLVHWSDDSWAVRLNGRGRWTGPRRSWMLQPGKGWPWGGGERSVMAGERCTVVARGLTGNESPDDLRRLAESFAVSETEKAGAE